MKALKAEKNKRNRGKRRNLIGEKDDDPQLFLLLRVQAARKFVYNQKVEKKQEKRDVKEKKNQQQRKKTQEEIEKKVRVDT